ncbi:S9 family peptidase [Arachnia propionica]|uniref:S9 family peptidase n=2 Tax=Arachnia propionica TaxID=1750 RepID=A0A3P1TCN3_9ACTN|nr:S9 family peptidase [Arachnia propionica]
MTLDEALLGTDSIRQVRASRDGVFWLASIAAEDGRTTIRRWDGQHVEDLTPESEVRTRVMEYGGGAYAVADGVVAWCDDRTQQVWVARDGLVRAVTPTSERFRYGGLALAPEHDLIVCVREDHAVAPEERTEIVALDLTGDNTEGGRVLVTGADFYAGVTVHGDQVAWFQWMHPDMSWDTAGVFTCPLDDPTALVAVAVTDGVSAQHPLWLGNGALAWVSDESGYWNWTVRDGDFRHQWLVPHDCSIPTWVLDAPPAAAVGEDLLATVEIAGGRGALALVRPSDGGVTYPLPGTAMIESVAARGEELFVIAEWPDRPASLVQISPTGVRHEIVTSQRWEGASKPVARWCEGPVGPVQSWFYPVPGATAPTPLLVLTHGGPTSVHHPSFDRSVQFWASRGVAVLDVNYSGSTGFGRAYRERLKGRWGVLEVADVEAAVQEVCRAGLADPGKVVIAGGSAGGYTTLQALVSSDIFAAGMSSYGIGDLTTLVSSTHKAESHYTFSLVGPWPEAEQLYRDRSPINHLDRLNTPMLILQGLQDKVVPPDQAFSLADAVRSQGLPVALVTFEDEGHGFRSLAARRSALESKVSFLEQVLDLTPSDDVPRLTIENLSSGGTPME